MKLILSTLILSLISFSTLSTEVIDSREKEIDSTLINGPECTKYLKEEFQFNIIEAYQICSLKTEEMRVCLIKNNKKSLTDKYKNCFKK